MYSHACLYRKDDSEDTGASTDVPNIFSNGSSDASLESEPESDSVDVNSDDDGYNNLLFNYRPPIPIRGFLFLFLACTCDI
jgi:hypothetical protein